eukprot:6190707-Pleurochrysis_carterae.AAC.3
MALPASVAMRTRPAEALSGGGAQTSWLRLSAVDDATGRMRRMGTTALTLGRRSVAVRRGDSAA